MKTVRKYVVDHHQGGLTLPDRAEPSPLYTSEEEAIEAFKADVSEALSEAYTEALANEAPTGDLIRVREELNAITIGLLLGLKEGEEIAATVAGQRYYLMLGAEVEVEPQSYLVEVDLDNLPTDVLSVADARKGLVERRKELLGRLSEEQVLHLAGALLDITDNLPTDDEGYIIDRISREVKAGIIIGLIEYGRQNFRRLDLGTFAQGERNGIVNGILLTAGVPYAVAGEMRPSKEWQNAHETIRTLILSGEEHPELTAYWLLDLPKGEAASENQPDFAEQIRPEEAAADEMLPANPWFAKEAKASVALDGDTFSLEPGQTLTPEGNIVSEG